LALADDLLTQAKHLARREPNRPKQASLRRAVSTAYYALFHLLASDGARKLAPAQPDRLRARVQRAFDHRTMKEVCAKYGLAASASNLPPHLADLTIAPFEPEFSRIGDAFVELQEARHRADYDVATPFDRNDVLQKIDLVERAFSDWDAVRSEVNANVFLAALLLNSYWKR